MFSKYIQQSPARQFHVNYQTNSNNTTKIEREIRGTQELVRVYENGVLKSSKINGVEQLQNGQASSFAVESKNKKLFCCIM